MESSRLTIDRDDKILMEPISISNISHTLSTYNCKIVNNNSSIVNNNSSTIVHSAKIRARETSFTSFFQPLSFNDVIYKGGSSKYAKFHSEIH